MQAEATKLLIYRLRRIVDGGPLAYDAIGIGEAADTIEELLAIADAAEDLRADAMRLDWLEANSDIRKGVFLQIRPGHQSAGSYIRSAIDAALSTVAPVREG